MIDAIKLQGYCWPDFNRRIDYSNQVIDTLSAQVQLAAQNAYTQSLSAEPPRKRSPHQLYADSIALQQQQQLRSPLNAQHYVTTSSAPTMQPWVPNQAGSYDYPAESEPGLQFYNYDASNPLANVSDEHAYYTAQDPSYVPQAAQYSTQQHYDS